LSQVVLLLILSVTATGLLTASERQVTVCGRSGRRFTAESGALSGVLLDIGDKTAENLAVLSF
jgi:hypothetical protein